MIIRLFSHIELRSLLSLLLFNCNWSLYINYNKNKSLFSPNIPCLFLQFKTYSPCVMCINSKDTLGGSLTKTNITATQFCLLLYSSWTWGSPSGLRFSGHQLFTSYMSCKLIMRLRLGLPCSPHKSSLHSDNQMTCPGIQSTACRLEEEEEGKESWAPSPLSWCFGSPPLQKVRVKSKKYEVSLYIRACCLYQFLKPLKLWWKLIQQLIRRELSTNNPQPHAGHPLEPEGKLKGRHF